MNPFDAAHLRVLEEIGKGASLRDSLHSIVALVEGCAPGMLCSILLFDAEHQTLHHGAAASLPAEYIGALDGSVIGERAGSCGTAAFKRERVIVEDIATHPYWDEHRHLALPHGLRACWSTPIFSSHGELLATFAMYYRASRKPNAQELSWVDTATRLAAIAIEHDRAQQTLRASEERALRLARLYAVSNEVSEAIVRVRDVLELYQAACRIPVEKGLACLAWVGAYRDADDRIEPLASFGSGREYVANVRLGVLDERINKGPAALALRTGKPAISRDIEHDPNFFWRDQALAAGLRTCAAFPLRIEDRIIGVLAMYHPEVGSFAEEEMRVLSALADNIAFAVESAARERQRQDSVYALGERVKELTLLHRVARVLQRQRTVDAEFLRDLIDPMPQAFQYPALCAARIGWNGFDAATPGYRETPWLLATPFEVGGTRGTIEVVYLEQPSSSSEVFLREEHELMRSVADMLCSYLERARLEDQLRQAQKMEAVGQLAGGVAHDFNNLLTVVLSYAALTIEALPPDDPLRADIEEIKRAGERASELTRQLLAFSRKQVLQPRATDLRATVLGLQKMLERLLGESIKLVTELDPSPGNAVVDPGQLEQVIVNLAVNARDAMARGGTLTIAVLRVAVPAQAESGTRPEVLLSVADTGCGMDAQTRERVFEPFFTTKDQGKGTGLGLSTVWGIVSQSGGRIEIDSELGRGTTFRVFLPCVESASWSAQEAERERKSLQGSETVLVVEDEASVRSLMRTVLTRHGYKVLDAQNGGEALLLCEQHEGSIDLLITDVVMPRMNGRELAVRLAALRPEMRVLYVSGYARDAAFQTGALDPTVAFLPKPITPEVLLSKVREVLV